LYGSSERIVQRAKWMKASFWSRSSRIGKRRVIQKFSFRIGTCPGLIGVASVIAVARPQRFRSSVCAPAGRGAPTFETATSSPSTTATAARLAEPDRVFKDPRAR